MTPRVGKIWLTIALGLCGLSSLATAQRTGAGNWPVYEPCASANLSGAVAVRAPERASNPFLSLCDGHPLSTLSPAGQGQPVALASADFDGDGVPDLVSGFSTGKAGRVTIHRGNVNALWPYGAALRNGPPPAFLPNPRSLALPESPDFLVTGDFDADGHWDIVTAQRGSNALYFLKGDGHGGFRSAQRVQLSGNVTAMIAGEVNRADGLADLIVAVNTANGARALVYESPTGAISASPEVFKLGTPATALALGKFDGNAMNDLAIASGNQLVVLHARDRKLSSDESRRAAVAPARVTVQKLSFTIQALAAGDFTGAGPAIAALGEDGKVHILEHAIAPGSLASRVSNNPHPSMQIARSNKDGKPEIVSGTMTAGLAARLEAMREAARTASSSAEWTERSAISLPAGFAQATPHLVTGRISGSAQEDILAEDSGNGKIHVLSTIAGKPRISTQGRAQAVNTGVPPSMKLISSLEAASAPAAVLPMRLSKSGLSGLVVLQAGQAEPTVMPQDAPVANTFVVTNTLDAIIPAPQPTQFTGPDGSLRAAIYNANQATGTSSIVFNIPTTDPGYNPATGTFLIQPLSQNPPGGLNNNALDSVYNTTIIDGYTQPGASPNTLANGDNAKILIQIDGSKATTPGGSGFTPFDDVGSVFRGFDFTGWTSPDISVGSGGGETASGAEGIEAGGVQDYIEGNFFGTDPTGKVAAPNRIGIFADAGPGFGSTAGGNIIGGTTPQARNILSGNNNSGVLFLSLAYEAQLQGNFIGLDATGTAIVSNPQEADRSNTFDGAGLNGSTVTIGGTLPGTANVIAGNGTNVDINDLTEGNQATNSIVQGNFIGTDATGKVAIPNQGYGVSILHNPTDMLIGGATPAARNVISGNLAGVYVFDNSFDNIVEGNYIGVDVTGTKAVPNVQEGFITGATTSSMTPAGDTTIGGSVAGAGNVISGNTLDGIQIAGTSLGPNGDDQTDQGNFILGNFIGTDATGKVAIPNGGDGIDLISGATNNIIGGSAPGSGNLIANNTQNGILIDPGTGSGNKTIANTILSNGGSGVRINTGSGNRISQNSIFGNGDLGINLQNAGPNLNSNCNSSNTGANNLQNAPSLTAGSGTAFISATATDPNGNTSEFSNAVAASASGNMLDLLGSFNSTPSTTYTIEFFSSTAADPSGYGEGQTYLTSTSVTTAADCSIAINNPVDTTKADLSVSLTTDTTVFLVGPDFGDYFFTATVTNEGLATAHNVVLTDTLPAGLEISSAYCNVGPCQTPVASSLGNCTVNGSKITCNLGTMASGATAQTTIPVQATAAGSLIDTASVTATEADPNLANNTASLTEAVDYNFPTIDHLDPASALTQTSGSLSINVYGNGFLPTSAVTFNGTPVTTTAYFDNQACGFFSPVFCSAIRVSVPASLLGTAGAATVTVTNPDPGPGGGANFPSSATFTIAPSCSFTVESLISFDFGSDGNLGADGTNLLGETVEVAPNVSSCAWTATSSVPWAVILDNASTTGSQTVDIAIAPNSSATPRSGSVTVAGQTFPFTQDGSADCTYAFSPASASYTFAGGTGSIPVTSGCFGYYVVPYASWITVPESVSLLSDNATTSYTVAANSGAPRTGNITIGGDVFTVTQSAPSCYYTLSTTSALIPTGGATGTIGVTPSSPSCAWTAKSSNTSLLSVTSGASGTGNGTVTYSAPVNTEGPQTAILTIGDATGYSIFTENQASAFNCTFTITPSSVEVSSNGVSNFVQVTASYGNCMWTAVSSDPTALTIGDTSAQSGLTTNGQGVGTGVIYYRVAQNTTGAPRVLTLTAGCQTFTINQGAPAAANPVPVLTSLLPSTAAAGSGAFTLTVNGSSFVNGAVVNFNGVARATTFVNANQVTAAILATDVASAGTPSVTVTNLAPGGGASNSLTFTITGPAAPSASLSPTALTFPDTAVGSSATAQTVTLSNAGTAALSISGISITGANPTDFSQTNTCGSSLAAGSHCSISVTFTPASAAGFSATLSVADNATGSPQTATLTGTGTTAPAPAVSLTPASLSFSVQSGTTSAAQAATLKNTGTAALSISGISITGAYPTDFAQTNTCGSSLAAGASCSISVTFTPASATSFAATLSVADNATGSPHAVTLTGTGTAAPSPAVSLTPSSLSFSVQSGTTSAAQIAMLKNTGDAVLNISGIAIGGANPTDFAQTNACGTTLAAGASCSISVTFTPASATSFAATVTVTDNATGSPQSVTLTGTGTPPPAPVVSLTPTSLTFSAQSGVSSPSQAVMLKNTGNAALNITGIALGGANASVFSQTNACGASLAAGASCSISVTFTPTGVASYAATLSIADNATGSPQTVTLSGTGTPPPAPVASLTPASLNFTAQTGSTSAAQTATLKNTGNAPLTITGITISGANTSDFAENNTDTCGESLAAGASCAISLTFTPASAASFSATLSVADNAAGSPQTVSLTGTGTVPPPPTFTISSTTTAQTVQPGGSAQYSITVTPQNGAYSNPVTFSATGLPAGATATFSPASLTPGSSAATTQLSIQTAAPVTAAGTSSGWPIAASVLPLLGLLFGVRKLRRRWVTLAVLLIASLGALTALTGCGGGFGLITSTSYSVTVTGTSGAIQQTTTVQLTVQ
jgi:uncharacterized repeat protein (TIGR01451 family)